MTLAKLCVLEHAVQLHELFKPPFGVHCDAATKAKENRALLSLYLDGLSGMHVQLPSKELRHP